VSYQFLQRILESYEWRSFIALRRFRIWVPWSIASSSQSCETTSYRFQIVDHRHLTACSLYGTFMKFLWR